MNAIVEWDEVEFLDLYPQFNNKLNSTQLAMLWTQTTTIVDNTENSNIPYDPSNSILTRKMALYALMCHLATMSFWSDGGQAGPLSSASEGSVSASFQLPDIGRSVTAQWYNQTPCGRAAWMLLRKYSLGGILVTPKHYHPFG